MFLTFKAVLPVNNSLVCCVRPASSWPRDPLSLVLIVMDNINNIIRSIYYELLI